MKTFKLTDVRKFMNLFLNGTVFDDFQMVEAVIKKYTTVSIDGHTNEEFYKNDETHTPSSEEYASWRELRPLCMDLIKGRNTPLYMKFILQKDPSSLSEASQAGYAAQAKALILNLTFSEQSLKLTTAINFTGFYPDSPLPEKWDEFAEGLLKRNDLKFDVI